MLQNIFSRASIITKFLLSHEMWKDIFLLTSTFFLLISQSPDKAKRSPPGDSVSMGTVTVGGFTGSATLGIARDGGSGVDFLLFTPVPSDLTKSCCARTNAYTCRRSSLPIKSGVVTLRYSREDGEDGAGAAATRTHPMGFISTGSLPPKSG